MLYVLMYEKKKTIYRTNKSKNELFLKKKKKSKNERFSN